MEQASYIEKVNRYHKKLNLDTTGERTTNLTTFGDVSGKKSFTETEVYSQRNHPSLCESIVQGSASFISRADHTPDPKFTNPLRDTVDLTNMRTILKEQVIEIPVYTERVVFDAAHLAHLYGQVALLAMENRRLRWKVVQLQQDGTLEMSDRQKISDIHETSLCEPHQGSRQMYEDLENKFNSLLEKYGEAREENERKSLEIEKLSTEIKSQTLEIDHLRRENEAAATALYVDKNNIFAKYKETEEANVKLEAKLLRIEHELEAHLCTKNELEKLKGLFEEKNEHLEVTKSQLLISVEDSKILRGLVASREKEIEKLNLKNAELIKIAQEYTHVKQMLDIARRDIETYKEAYENREKLLLKLGRELSEIDNLNLLLQEKTARISFLEDEIKRLNDKIEEKEIQLEIMRSRTIDQDLEKFRNNELSSQVNQLTAKLDFSEKKLALRGEENEALQRKLLEATLRIQELKTYEIKLDQIATEREDLLNQIYQLKKDLLEMNKLEKDIQSQQGLLTEKQILIDRLKEKLESLKKDLKEAKSLHEEQKSELFEQQKKLKEAEETKCELGEAKDQLKGLKTDFEELEGAVRQLNLDLQERDNQIARLKNELKETSEKNKTKLSMLQADNSAMEEKLRSAQEFEKRLEKAVSMNNDMRNANDNLLQKTEILSKELRTLEANLDKQKETNTLLENKINILKEVEAKNQDLQKAVETLSKEILETQANNRRLSLEKEQVREEVSRAKEETDVLKREVEKKEDQVKKTEQVLEQAKGETEAKLKDLCDKIAELVTSQEVMKEHIEQEKETTEDWKKKYDDLCVQFDKYIKEYEVMSLKYERMSCVNDDHVKDIENKAFTIAQLQKRLLIQMIELSRQDYIRSTATCRQ